MFSGISPVCAAEKLLDILRQKGTISEEEYRNLKADEEAEKARIEALIKQSQPPFDVTYKDGFRITSRDKRHALRLGVQIFNQVSIFPEDADANSNFLLRRGRVTFRGKVFQDFTYRLELDGTSTPVLDQDAYFGWEKYKAFRIRAGQHKTRFGGEQIWSRYSLFFLERSMISGNLTEGASRGVFIFSDPAANMPVTLEFSVTNGTRRSNDNNDDKDFALRVIGRPFQGTSWKNVLPIEMAGNFTLGKQPFNANGARTRLFLRDNRLIIFNAETKGLRQRYGGDIWYNKDYRNTGGLPLAFQFEFIYERQERDQEDGLADIVRQGYHLQAGYLVLGSRSKHGLEPVFRLEYIDMDNEGGGTGVNGQNLYVYGFGLNYWPIKEIRLSVNGFIFDFDRPLTEEGGSSSSDDPFKNGGNAWAMLLGAYFKF
jgi:hypothetical protein